MQLVHDITFMEESMEGFDNFLKSLKEELQMVKAEKEVAEELKLAMEEKLNNKDAEVQGLKNELKKA